MLFFSREKPTDGISIEWRGGYKKKKKTSVKKKDKMKGMSDGW